MKKILITFILAAILIAPVVMPETGSAQLAPLSSVAVPEPPNLSKYIMDKDAAIQLGKALYWDMQVGSDGVQACGTCHFHAGADSRNKNQLNPGTLAGDTRFGNNRIGLPSPKSIGAPEKFRPNVGLTRGHFPLHKLTDSDFFSDPADPFFNPADIISDTNDVVSSMGVEMRQFVDIVPGNPVDLSAPIADPVFQIGGVNIRRVEPRNTPSVINAVFNFANFWDGRANNIFNGDNPFGPVDPRYHAIVDVNGFLNQQPVRIRHASLASQAAGPPLSDFEMSWKGRTWQKIGKKMLSLRPLAQQRVHVNDSVLGLLRDGAAGTGLNTTYKAMIKKAFLPKFWKNTTWHVHFVDGQVNFQSGPPRTTDEYTQMEANFGLFFALSVQLYEATLIADQSRVDLSCGQPGGCGSGLTLQEQRGMSHFIDSCIACHAGPETTDVSVENIQGADPITGVPQPLTKNPLAASEFMSFMIGTGLYDNGFHNHGSRPGGSIDPAAGDYLAVNEDTGRDALSGLPAPLENFHLCWSDLGLRATGFLSPALPAWLTPYVPPLPYGFRPVDTFPWRGREGNGGAFKTPGLRNVELTGPYMHNGGLSTLHQVVEFYARGGDFPFTNQFNFDPAVLPLGLLLANDTRKNELVAFLVALTDERVKKEQAPFDHPEIFIPIDGRAPVSPGTRDGFLTPEMQAMFKRIPEVGVGGRLVGDNDLKTYPVLGTFLSLSPFSP